jgi:putative transposase
MPRSARVKLLGGVYHIMVRGISELKLFKTKKEKEIYLRYLKKYQAIFQFKVYAFCIMNSHAHLIIGSNGADISKIMHGINGSYVKYFNKKHDRHGHALSDRFKSILISDDTYLLNASLYVHRNPKDIEEYKDKIDEYKYSSISSYIHNISDEIPFIPIDTELILRLVNQDANKARDIYYKMVMKKESEDTKAERNFDNINDTYDYLSGKKYMFRNISPDAIIEYVSASLNIKKETINIKYKRKPSVLRALSILLMRCLCDTRINEICKIIGNITAAEASFLCSKGFKLIDENDGYHKILKNFIDGFALTK